MALLLSSDSHLSASIGLSLKVVDDAEVHFPVTNLERVFCLSSERVRNGQDTQPGFEIDSGSEPDRPIVSVFLLAPALIPGGVAEHEEKGVLFKQVTQLCFTDHKGRGEDRLFIEAAQRAQASDTEQFVREGFRIVLVGSDTTKIQYQSSAHRQIYIQLHFADILHGAEFQTVVYQRIDVGVLANVSVAGTDACFDSESGSWIQAVIQSFEMSGQPIAEQADISVRRQYGDVLQPAGGLKIALLVVEERFDEIITCKAVEYPDVLHYVGEDGITLEEV